MTNIDIIDEIIEKIEEIVEEYYYIELYGIDYDEKSVMFDLFDGEYDAYEFERDIMFMEDKTKEAFPFPEYICKYSFSDKTSIDGFGEECADYHCLLTIFFKQ